MFEPMISGPGFMCFVNICLLKKYKGILQKMTYGKIKKPAVSPSGAFHKNLFLICNDKIKNIKFLPQSGFLPVFPYLSLAGHGQDLMIPGFAWRWDREFFLGLGGNYLYIWKEPKPNHNET